VSDVTTDEHAGARETFRDPACSVAQRIEDLLGRMTLAEKLGQMMVMDARRDLGDIVLRKQAGSVLHASPARLRELHALVQRTRLRIPLLVAEDGIHGHSFWEGATIFPEQLGMAASFDPELVERVARAAAVEIAATGVHWTLSPVLCIARDPRWGRVGETFGEDPHLIGELGAAMIRGYQGDSLKDLDSVLACAKHFAGYSETVGGRDSSEADLSRRKLRSWFLPPFQRAIEEGCRTVMVAYHSIEGVPVTTNRWLINDVLRDEWGFDGALVTDWDNVGALVTDHQVCRDLAEAAAVAVHAGNNLMMNTPGFVAGAEQAIASGRLNPAEVDQAVRNILRLKFELGLFEDPRLPSADRQVVIGCSAHAELNLEAARRSLVLLHNNGLLPLNSNAPHKRIAVLGPNADDAQGQLGDWAGNSGQIDWMPDGQPRALIETVLDGLRAVAPAGWEIRYARGADIVQARREGDEPDSIAGTRDSPWRIARPDWHQTSEAASLARWAEQALVVVGDNLSLAGEWRSTATLELVGGQIDLINAVVATGTPTTVVVISSKPLIMPPAALNAAALLQAFSPGMRGGRAIAELLLGLIEPTGRLPMSVPRHAGQLPVYYNQIRGQHGNRYADMTQEPQFAFGEGLSYTRVEYDDLQVLTPVVASTETVRASIRLSNVGDRPALEAIQVYVRDAVASVTWADRELKALTQVHLDPGESRLVEISVPASRCSVVDQDGRRAVEPGGFQLLVGCSSRPSDLLHAEFAVV
jgi:beta-glucosidase